MFCTQCGETVSEEDLFCRFCGEELNSKKLSTERTPRSNDEWRSSFDYRKVLHHPEVINTIRSLTTPKSAGMSSDEYLLAALPLLGVTGVAAVPLSAMVDILPKWGDRIGIRSGKSEEQHFSLQPGEAIAAIACSFATRGMQLIDGEQAIDGCILTAKFPSNIWTGGGEISACITPKKSYLSILATTTVPGQLFDWGTSRRLLNGLFEDLPRFASLLPK